MPTTPEHFFDVFENTARAVLLQTSHPTTEMEKVMAVASASKRFAMYPCSRYSRKIIGRMKEAQPELLNRLVGVFDKSDNINFRNDVPLFSLSEAGRIEFDTLIVSASKFPDDLLPDLRQAGIPEDKIFLTSYFREQLSLLDPAELIAQIRHVVDVLADDKSRITYLLTWISLLLLDKDILSVYRIPLNTTFQPDGRVRYHGMEFHHLYEFIIQASLFLEIYRMEHVYPAEGDIVFDIGAYRGDTVAYFRKYLGNTGKIYAFEPDEINFRYLQDNIRRNRLANVVPVQKALLDDEKTCNLITIPQGGSFLYIIKDGLDTNAFTEVEAITIDSFMASQQIPRLDFIKSDIEGCELAMLQGGKETIRRHRPKMALAIYHSITDLLKIPLFVYDLNPEYKLYFRHWNFINIYW